MILQDNQVLRVQLEWHGIDGRNAAGRIITEPTAIVFDLRTQILGGPKYGIRQRLTADQLHAYAGDHAGLLEAVLDMMQSRTFWAIEKFEATGEM